MSSVEIECKIKHETENAILIEVAEVDYWVPFSQVDQIHRSPKGDTIHMSEWIAKQKGIL